MEGKVEREGLEHLKNIEEDIEEIKERTPNPRRTFINGILWGAGSVVGTIITLALVGWLLSVTGLIPGLRDMVEYLQNLVAQVRR